MKKVYLFTSFFPYAKSESFIETEMVIASKLGIDLTIIPHHQTEEKRSLPSNIKLCNDLALLSRYDKIIVFFDMLFSLHFYKLPFQQDFTFAPKDIFNAFKYLYGSFKVFYFLKKKQIVFDKESVLYSYWFNHTPLGLVWALKKIPHFSKSTVVTRAHGYDVYEKMRGVYFPYRQECLKDINKVMIVSQDGVDFLQKRYLRFKLKIVLSRLGVLEINTPVVHQNATTLSLVSCSGLSKVKRVDLIYNSIRQYALKRTKILVEWTHIGDGELLDMLKKEVQASNIPNLKISLVGAISNEEVKKIYEEKEFDFFINLSLSEGIPVSIMEAIAAGMGIIATDAGGNREVLPPISGCLLPVFFEQKQFDEALDSLSKIDKSTCRVLSKTFFNENYEAMQNYKTFYRTITKLDL